MENIVNKIVGSSCKPKTCNWAHRKWACGYSGDQPGYRRACKGLSFALPSGERVLPFLMMEGSEGRAFVRGEV